VSPLRVLYPSPVADPPAFLIDPPTSQLQRVFSEDIEIQLDSEGGRTPQELVQEVRDWAADAIVLSSLAPGHHQAVMKLAGE